MVIKMLRPSYSELMDVIMQSDKLDSKVTSRYTVVMAAAKRARQLTDGANPLTYAPTDRAVSTAVKEMSEGKLRINIREDLLDGSYEHMVKNRYRYRGMTALSKDDLREELKEDYGPDRYNADDDDELFPDSDEESPDYGIYEEVEGNEEAFEEEE